MSSKIELAAKFINSTAQHIFLTGKAGTGKTTFLNDLAQATHKNFLVVAPTGIAALNAGGTTIHSQFLLPLGSFLPQASHFKEAPQSQFYTARDLAAKHSLNADRKKVLHRIDLLVIDEVSMLRADVLDAISHRLKAAKKNYSQPFGGVQLLLVGDLFQLPPIVKNHEWEYLQQFYQSIHFFNALALKEAGFVYLEFDKVFRQSNPAFINLLNNLRANRCTPQDLELLNSHYTEEEEETGVINITTHNKMANAENERKLAAISAKPKVYNAKIEDDFPEHIYPISAALELKVGAQVMFIKNATDGAYFNGKMAHIKELKADGICVEMEGHDEFWVESYVWKNIKFQLNEKNQEITENVLGSFEQYPLKLAWAITVHKSQGLTFEKAVLNLGRAFAPGQVYVALSRLRSLDGLRLKTKLSPSAISADNAVSGFISEHQQDDQLPVKLAQAKQQYAQNLVAQTFSAQALLKQVDYVRQKMSGKLSFKDNDQNLFLDAWHQKLQAETANLQKFSYQLALALNEQKHEFFLKRLQAGASYYLQFFKARLVEIQVQLHWLGLQKKVKTYFNYLEEVHQMTKQTAYELVKAPLLFKALLAEENFEAENTVKSTYTNYLAEVEAERNQFLQDNPKEVGNATRKRSKKGETHQTTYQLLKDGLKMNEVATKRGLALATIESHVSRGIAEGILHLSDFMREKEQEHLGLLFKKHFNPKDGFKSLHAAGKGVYTYGQLRMYQAHLEKDKT
jgi:type II secretory pathway predicted ATPase ExeA